MNSENTKNMVQVGQKAPDITAIDQYGKTHTLSQYRGKWVLLYFYPKDDTSGCTKEACGFRDSYEQLQQQLVVLGVSADSVESHKAFAEKYHLPFTLLADTGKDIIQTYGAQGTPFTKRISFLINPEGVIVKEYPKVDPAVHSQEIVQDLTQFQT